MNVAPKARSQWAYARIRFFRHRMAVLSLVVLFAISLVAIFAKRVAPYGYDELDLFNITSPPTTKDKHLFGTDLLGRDYLSRVIFGLRTSLWVAFFVAFLSTAIGTTVGAIAGYYGGAIDNLLMRFTDLMMAFPSLLLAIALAAIFTPSLWIVAMVIAMVNWVQIARVIYTQTVSLTQREFIEAVRSLGASKARILFVHVVPHLVPTIVVWGTLGIATTVLLEATLSFLGIGVQPPTPSWGNIIFENQSYFSTAPWLVFLPGAAIVLMAVAFNILGDALREALDPTLSSRRA